MADQPALHRLCAQLVAAPNNPPHRPDLDDVATFHERVDKAAGPGFNVDFIVDRLRFHFGRDLCRRRTGGAYAPGEQTSNAETRYASPDALKTEKRC